MPLPTPADLRDRTKKHSQVREMLAQMAENVESKEGAQEKANAVLDRAKQLAQEELGSIDSRFLQAVQVLASTLAEMMVDNSSSVSSLSKNIDDNSQAIQKCFTATQILVEAFSSLQTDNNAIFDDVRGNIGQAMQALQIISGALSDLSAEFYSTVDVLKSDNSLTVNAVSNILSSVQIVASVVAEIVNAEADYFSDESKLERLIIQQQIATELAKLDGFDPTTTGANKYVEAGNIVFFPTPSNVIRIDIETSQNLPSAKGTVIQTMTAINVDGQILKGFGTLEVQGSSSASFPKKNWTISIFLDAERTSPKKIKLGYMIPQEELVWKANFVDNTHSRNLAANRLWGQFVANRSGFPKNEVDAVNMLNSDLTAESFAGLSYMPTGATGYVDGFQAVVYINGNFYGIGSLNIGKKRDNYNLASNNQKHIQVSPEGNWTDGTSFTNMPLHPDDINPQTNSGYYEIRRPSTWGDEAQASWERLRVYTALSKEDMQSAGIDNYFNRKNLMDYIILIQVCDLWDHMGKNSLITTWDGLVWNFMPYDLDTCFGLDWLGIYFNTNGSAKHPATALLIPQNGTSGNNGFFSKCRRIYGSSIDTRYADLRKSGVISVDNIVGMCEGLLRKFPQELLKLENEKWNTGSGSIYTSLMQTGSIHQIYNWLSSRIPACDTYFNYTA